MNRLLVKALRIFNGILAIVIILFMTLFGIHVGIDLAGASLLGGMDVGPVLGGIGGLLSGIFLAVVFCGGVAVLLEIPGKLGEIRDALNRRSL